jgi:hypothetical protein
MMRGDAIWNLQAVTPFENGHDVSLYPRGHFGVGHGAQQFILCARPRTKFRIEEGDVKFQAFVPHVFNCASGQFGYFAIRLPT